MAVFLQCQLGVFCSEDATEMKISASLAILNIIRATVFRKGRFPISLSDPEGASIIDNFLFFLKRKYSMRQTVSYQMDSCFYVQSYTLLYH